MPMPTRELQSEYSRLWVTARRDAWIESQGGKCARCGGTERLEVDHIERSEKAFNPRQIWSRRVDIRLAELAKCQVLCRACHIEKTRSEFSKPIVHGTLVAYKKKKCRCDECRKANREVVRAQRVSASLLPPS